MADLEITINGRTIGQDRPTYIIAEISANHNQEFEEAVRLIHAAKEAGADAIKLQTYTPDTMTIDCNNEYFQISKGTIWEGRSLYDLYGEAYTPWDWQPKLQSIAGDLGMDLFSTPYDFSAVEFLEEMDIPVFKVASFENVDIPLMRRIAKTGKPVIMSTGMATLAEIDEAVTTIREAGCKQLAILKCTSTYPAPPEEMHLRTIPHLRDAFNVPVGLSDHTVATSVPAAAVALGACIIEKHFTLSRETPGPDSSFSLEPAEFKIMVDGIRTTEKALGTIHYGVNQREAHTKVFRRSLFVVEDMKAGEVFNPNNVRSIRPSHGLHTRYIDDVMGHKASKDIARGTPLGWALVGAQ
jgi:N-acetylneuraminate synthase